MKNSKTVVNISWWILLLSSVGVAGYAFFTYGFLPIGDSVGPAMKTSFENNAFAVYCHIFASSVALLLGPFQFSAKLRAGNIRVHRLIGRIYLSVGILIGGLAGLYIAQTAFGGLVSIIGFSALALLWLFTGTAAYLAIRNKDVTAHRKWMIRNFSLTFAAVTLRIYLGLFFASGAQFEDFYPLLAWICWVPNLIIADWVFNRNIKST